MLDLHKLHFWNLRLAEHKSIEFQYAHWEESRMFDIQYSWRRGQDHPGFGVTVTLFWRSFSFDYYDHRHWEAIINSTGADGTSTSPKP